MRTHRDGSEVIVCDGCFVVMDPGVIQQWYEPDPGTHVHHTSECMAKFVSLKAMPAPERPLRALTTLVLRAQLERTDLNEWELERVRDELTYR